MYYKIVNKTLFRCDQFGNPVRAISENVSFGTFDEKTQTFLVTKLNGVVELKDYNGTIIRTILSNNGVEARFDPTGIVIRTTDGRTRLVDRNGTIKRFL